MFYWIVKICNIVQSSRQLLKKAQFLVENTVLKFTDL